MPIHKPTLNIEAARQVNLVGLCQVEGIELKQVGELWVGLCPWHSEDTPSFTVYQDNHYHCFGCEKHGSSIDFLMEIRQISFREAVQALSTELGIQSHSYTQKRVLTPNLPTKRVVDRDLVEMWYQQLLKLPERLDYWYGRLFTRETIERERLGWNGEGYFSIPVGDVIPQCSDVLSVRFRAGDGQEPRYKGISGFNESALYNRHCISGNKTICFFFGELDALLCSDDGMPSVSPTNGKESFDPSWVDYFTGVERVIIIPDRDDPKKLIPKRKVNLQNLNVKEKYQHGVVTEYESALSVCEFFGRRAEIKVWDSRFVGKDYSEARENGMTAIEFSEWVGIE